MEHLIWKSRRAVELPPGKRCTCQNSRPEGVPFGKQGRAEWDIPAKVFAPLCPRVTDGCEIPDLPAAGEPCVQLQTHTGLCFRLLILKAKTRFRRSPDFKVFTIFLLLFPLAWSHSFYDIESCWVDCQHQCASLWGNEDTLRHYLLFSYPLGPQLDPTCPVQGVEQYKTSLFWTSLLCRDTRRAERRHRVVGMRTALVWSRTRCPELGPSKGSAARWHTEQLALPHG